MTGIGEVVRELATLLGVLATLTVLVGTVIRLGILTGEWRMKFETITKSLDTISHTLGTHDGRLKSLEINVARIETRLGDPSH